MRAIFTGIMETVGRFGAENIRICRDTKKAANRISDAQETARRRFLVTQLILGLTEARRVYYGAFLNTVNPCQRNSLTLPSEPRTKVIMSLSSERSFQST